MIYLLFAILTSASIALLFKFSENRNLDRVTVTSFNYLAASVVSLVILEANGRRLPFVDFSVDFDKLSGLFSPTVADPGPESSLIWGMVVGIPAGLAFFLAFIFYQKGIRENGAGLAGAFSKIGILIPMTVSILLWNEIPTIFQSFGIGLSVLSILLVNLSWKNFDPKKFRLTLLALFVFSGLAEFSNKVFQKYGSVDDKLVFLFFVFFTAFLISAGLLVFRGKLPSAGAVFLGLLVGLPNLFCSYFLILALDELKAAVVFPVYTATTIVLINIGGYLLFRERLAARERVSIGMIVVALILINVS